MKIPGLDDALSRLNVFEDEMLPLLAQIAARLEELVELQRQALDRDDSAR